MCSQEIVNGRCSCVGDGDLGLHQCPHCKKTVPLTLYCIRCGLPLYLNMTPVKHTILSAINIDMHSTRIEDVFSSLPETKREVIRTYVAQMYKDRLLERTGWGEYRATPLGRLALREYSTKTEVKQEDKKEYKKATVILDKDVRKMIRDKFGHVRIARSAISALASIMEETGIDIINELKLADITPERINKVRDKFSEGVVE